METKNSKMFEKFIRDSFQEHEVPYSANEWTLFESKLDKAIKQSFYKKIKYTSLGFVIVAAFVTLYYLNNPISIKNDNTSIENVVTESKQVISNTNNNIQEIEKQDLKTITSNKPVINKTVNHAPEITQVDPIKTESVKEETHAISDANKTSITEVMPVNNTLTPNQTKTIDLSIEVNKSVICVDEEIHFFPSIHGQNFEYNWSFGDETNSSKENTAHSYNKGGAYEVRLNIYDKLNGQTYSASTNVLVNKKPDANFDYEIAQEGLAYPQVVFVDKSSDALYWEWNFGDGKTSYEQNPLHVYFINSDKKINVSLTAMNVHSCKSKLESTIEFKNVFDIMAPNAFSPDGDGLNDYFIPKALEIYDIPFEMFIYDRDGILIYNTKNKSFPWDGRIAQTGIIPQSGTFIWIVIMKDSNGNNIKYGGTVSIIK